MNLGIQCCERQASSLISYKLLDQECTHLLGPEAVQPRTDTKMGKNRGGAKASNGGSGGEGGGNKGANKGGGSGDGGGGGQRGNTGEPERNSGPSLDVGYFSFVHSLVTLVSALLCLASCIPVSSSVLHRRWFIGVVRDEHPV